MPELPEIETTRRGITKELIKSPVADAIIRQPSLRWPIPDAVYQLKQQQILKVSRRGKYLLLDSAVGTLIIHLGMSGCLRVLPKNTPVKKHDHFDVVLNSGLCLRLNDPRRFGCVLWTKENPLQHRLLKNLGVEPLTKRFDGAYLKQKSQKCSKEIKSLIMDSHCVVGVGNIYANESLFLAGIHPKKPCNKISLIRYEALANSIKLILKQAIKLGGTTLKDFYSTTGKPGYFRNELKVYDRENQLCYDCQKPIRRIVMNSRSTYYCTYCQR